MAELFTDDNHETPEDGAKLVWYQRPWLKTLVKGAIYSLPFLILLFLVTLLFDLIFGLLSPLSAIIAPGSEKPHWIFHIISLSIIFGIFYLIGLSAKNRVSKYYFSLFEKEYLKRIPLYTTIRDLVQQFTGMKKMPFSDVVLIDTFESGVLMTGFVTEQVSDDLYTVFVPTAPNPTNGNIYHVPASRITFVDATPEEAMRTIVGMGTGSYCLFREDQIDCIEEAEPEKA
ncbi:DUF502 domain-containing protein [Portibacter marinus]|uniref:DUF502 domain-containing protein n=1 Tax=Portibacter marinus TaxID=2898660 RepID=UPI001F1BC387|nr:DUF502 domain-containing protein [Portibacter marinus]